ncbi:MAG: SPOR domain-containing protein [Spirochaetales bacterium]|nr:SPOR domain-containing protein [Spirochaetales bacterium]
MTDDIKKEMSDTKISTDTLFVLLLVISGIAAIIFVAYLLYKPYNVTNDVVIKDVVVSSILVDDNPVIESVEESLENSYLAKDEVLPEPEVEDVLPVIEKKPDPVIAEKPIFKPKAVLEKTPTKTTIVKSEEKKQKLVTVKAYWIQVGSFSTSAQASKSVEALKERGLSSRVVLKTVDGKSVYRVRIGAYESKEEADKFCDEVKKIAGYEGSYVSESTTQKYVDI